MSSFRWFIVTLVACLLAIAWFILPHSERTGRPVNVEPLVRDNGASTKTRVAATIDSTADRAGVRCTPREAALQSPEAYKIDEWFMSWGAPPNFNTSIPARQYAYMGVEDLKNLSAAGDVDAVHELGLDLVWTAFHGGDGMPEYTTLWDANSDSAPFLQNVDAEKLARGRENLYEAALRGHTYALLEISLSYALLRTSAMSGAALSDDKLRQLQINAYAYGEAVENLIPGLHENYFGASIPQDAKSEADNYAVSLSDKIMAEREERGLEVAALPGTGGEILQRLRLCAD